MFDPGGGHQGEGVRHESEDGGAEQAEGRGGEDGEGAAGRAEDDLPQAAEGEAGPERGDEDNAAATAGDGHLSARAAADQTFSNYLRRPTNFHINWITFALLLLRRCTSRR